VVLLGRPATTSEPINKRNAGNRSSSRIIVMLVMLIATGLVSLSIHVALQQLAGVPYPDVRTVPSWAKFLRPAGEYAALIAVWWMARETLLRRHVGLRVLLVAAAYAMCKETVRGAVMNGVVTTAFGFHFLSLLPALATFLMMTALSGIAAWLPRRDWVLVGAGLLLALIQAFAVSPAIAGSLGAWVSAFSGLDHAEVYAMPYGAHVLVPAYVTYVEPVLGSLLICALIWRACGSTLARRLLMFALVLEFLTGEIVPPVVWSFFGERPWPIGFASMAQFTLEHLVLALGVGLSWHVWTTPAAQA
jgi:hypothetical protein